MLPFLSSGCVHDPCPRINARMQILAADLMMNPNLLDSEPAAADAQRLAIDSVRYGCIAR
ncbi:hypothetical protein [Roseiterribacter gracilis]